MFPRYGKTPGYPTLAAGTGYGTGAGLGGWNCRHSYHPFFPGYESSYSADILKEYQRKTCTYNGKALTEYEVSQQQRYFERGIRRWKREYTAMDAAGLDTTQAAVKLKQWREKEADFLRQTGRRRDSSRSQIGTFGRSEASKAMWAARKFEQFSQAITGTTASTGVVVTEVSPHIFARCNERGVSEGDIVNALTTPLRIGKIRADMSQQFIGEKATVVLNTETGKAVTVWPTSANRAQKLKGGS